MVKHTTDNIHDLAASAVSEVHPVVVKNLVEAKDLTEEFLSAPVIPSKSSLPTSSLRVYRGMIRKLEGIKATIAEGATTTRALLGSCENVVLDAILIGDSISGSLANPMLLDRWKNHKCEPSGLVVWEAGATIDPEKYRKDLMELDAKTKTILLIVIAPDLQHKSWELSIPEGGSSTDTAMFSQVRVNVNENRKKDEAYCVCRVDLLGVTFDDKVSSLVGNAICRHMKESMAKSTEIEHARLEMENQMNYIAYKVPADGHCFWHSVSASLNLAQWCSVPRKSSGYATHPANVKLEESYAKSLWEQVLGLAAHSKPEIHVHAADLEGRGGVVDVVDVPWIAFLLGIRIRVSLHPEARGPFCYVSFLKKCQLDKIEYSQDPWPICEFVETLCVLFFVYILPFDYDFVQSGS